MSPTSYVTDRFCFNGEAAKIETRPGKRQIFAHMSHKAVKSRITGTNTCSENLVLWSDFV
eukprot:4323138-Amphidinium_carterae.1